MMFSFDGGADKLRFRRRAVECCSTALHSSVPYSKNSALLAQTLSRSARFAVTCESRPSKFVSAAWSQAWRNMGKKATSLSSDRLPFWVSRYSHRIALLRGRLSRSVEYRIESRKDLSRLRPMPD